MQIFRLREELAISVIATLLSATLVACSESDSSTQNRGYALPSTFCGLEVPQGSISKIFKDGEKIHKEDGAPWGERTGRDSQGCRYDIDGLPSVDLDGDWVSREFPVRIPDSKKALKKYYPSATPHRAKGRFDASTWLHGFVVTIECRSRDENYTYDWFQVRLDVDQLLFKDSEFRTHKEYAKLAMDVGSAVQKKLPCGEV